MPVIVSEQDLTTLVPNRSQELVDMNNYKSTTNVENTTENYEASAEAASQLVKRKIKLPQMRNAAKSLGNSMDAVRNNQPYEVVSTSNKSPIQ